MTSSGSNSHSSINPKIPCFHLTSVLSRHLACLLQGIDQPPDREEIVGAQQGQRFWNPAHRLNLPRGMRPCYRYIRTRTNHYSLAFAYDCVAWSRDQRGTCTLQVASPKDRVENSIRTMDL